MAKETSTIEEIQIIKVVAVGDITMVVAAEAVAIWATLTSVDAVVEEGEEDMAAEVDTNQ